MKSSRARQCQITEVSLQTRVYGKIYLALLVNNNGYANLRECPTAPELPRLRSLINIIPCWVFISHVSVKNKEVSRPALVANENAI